MTISVLVTGGAGYIGSHACKALHAAGYRPVAYDNLCLGREECVRWGPLVRGDTRDADAVRRAIADHRISAVMHFAAFAYVGESVADPGRYYDNNVVGMLGVLRGMQAAACDRLVFSSTCAVYGEPSRLPITEASPTRPVNPYGRSKLICEEMIRDFTYAHDLRSIVLRYFNASGADPDGELGENRAIETHLIPRAMMALQGHVTDFRVFGDDFATPDGTAIRDYVHVSDLADAHVLALRRLLDDGIGIDGTFNLGTGVGHSVGTVLSAIAAVSGRALGLPRGARRPGDPAALVADPALAQTVLGFRPRHSDLDTIVRTAWAWHSKAHPRLSGDDAAEGGDLAHAD